MVKMKKLSIRYILYGLMVSCIIGSAFLFVSHHDASASAKPAAFESDIFYLKGHDLDILSPETGHRKTAVEIVKYLRYAHYKQMTLDNALSEKIFDRYLSDLDSMKLYFLQTDIADFAPFRDALDDALRNGELEPAYIIFNRYQRRAIDRLTYMVRHVENGLDTLDFSINETINTDRENAPWPENSAKQDELWHKRLKNEVLGLKLAGKADDEIKKTLTKRYENQIKQIQQRNSEDVFRLFVNAYSQLYDPHTQYFSPRLTENFNIMMRLSLEGIGAVLQRKDEYTKIIRLITAGPAEKSGQLKPGDRIVGVGQGLAGEMVDVVGWRLDEVVQLIRGPKETYVRLQVIPVDAVDEFHTQVVKIKRNTVKLEDQAVKKKVITLNRDNHDFKIGVIDIPTFYIDFDGYQKGDPNYRSTTRDVHRLLSELKKENIDGLIIDLRDNGGGALQEAYQLTGLFLKEGPIVQVRDDRGRVRSLNDPDPSIIYNGPLVVVINRLSASASEIFAGAIQDYHRGVIVGSQTFGKGTVQTLESLYEGQLKLTHGMFFRVSGDSTQHRGIIPDIFFPSLYDQEKIGESALPDALPWEKIRPVKYHPYAATISNISQLRSLHKERVKDDLGFAYLAAGIERLKDTAEQKILSLEEKERVAEREKSDKKRLELVNMRRTAQGLDPLKTIAELKAEDEKEEELAAEADPNKDDAFDPILVESQNILADYIELTSKTVAGRWVSEQQF